LSTGAVVTATDFGSTEIRAETIAHRPASVDPAPAELEQIDVAALIEPATTLVVESGERERVPTVSMLEAAGAQASAPLRIETENGDEVPTVSMLEAAMQRLATEPDVGRPPRLILAAVAARAEEPPVAAPMAAEATREAIVAAIDEEATALLHGSESSSDSERGATILVLPAAAGPVATTLARESTVEQASAEEAERAEDGFPPLEIAPVVFDPGAGRARETADLAPPAAVGSADALATASTPSIVPSAFQQPGADAEAQPLPSRPAGTAPAGAEREPTGAAPLLVQLKPQAPAAATEPVREPEPIPGPADTSASDLAELLFEPAPEPSTPISLPNPLPVVQFENGSSAEAAPKSSAQVVPKPGAFASVSLQSVERGGPNVAPLAAAPKGLRTEALAAAAAASSPAPRGATQQSPQRPMARPATNDPLAAILALSEEEKIALFS
jgi:hypothetical protein